MITRDMCFKAGVKEGGFTSDCTRIGNTEIYVCRCLEWVSRAAIFIAALSVITPLASADLVFSLCACQHVVMEVYSSALSRVPHSMPACTVASDCQDD